VFATLMALERDGDVQLGVISAPALRQRWFAWRGGGAWSTGSAGSATRAPRRLRVSGVQRLEDAQVLYGSASDVRESERAPGFDALLARAWRERGFGDFWGYSLVAEGAAETMIEIGLKPWDIAAPRILVEEAGGTVSDYDGGVAFPSGDIVASNGHLHEHVLQVLRGTG